MQFSMLENAVLCSALKKYCEFLERCLKNPENDDQLIFIEGELQVAQQLQEKLKHS